MKMMSSQMLAMSAFAAMMSSLMAPSADAADAPKTAPDFAAQDEFAHPHRLVDIGGRRLNIYCSGTGSPTVVFDAYSGGSGWAWAGVQPQVARQTRACVYDRAGLGFSDPATRAGTSENAVDDLHRLLGAAGIKPPYVMVGNSYGGMNVQLYAYRFPKEVSGLVLVEAGNEDETGRFDRATNGKISQISAMFDAQRKTCRLNAQKGFIPGSETAAQCAVISPPGTGPAVAAAQLALGRSANYWKAANAEDENRATSDAQLRAARKPFGGLPLAVLTRGVSPYAVPGKPQSAMNKALEDENLAIQEEVAKLSTRGTNRVVPGAAHLIEEDRPDEVVRSIRAILAQLK